MGLLEQREQKMACSIGREKRMVYLVVSLDTRIHQNVFGCKGFLPPHPPKLLQCRIYLVKRQTRERGRQSAVKTSISPKKNNFFDCGKSPARPRFSKPYPRGRQARASQFKGAHPPSTTSSFPIHPFQFAVKGLPLDVTQRACVGDRGSAVARTSLAGQRAAGGVAPGCPASRWRERRAGAESATVGESVEAGQIGRQTGARGDRCAY